MGLWSDTNATREAQEADKRVREWELGLRKSELEWNASSTAYGKGDPGRGAEPETQFPHRKWRQFLPHRLFPGTKRGTTGFRVCITA